MSDAAPVPDDHHEANHEGPIRTPKQLIAAVIAAFVVPIATIVLLVIYVSSDPRSAAGSDGLAAQATAARIAPVGQVAVKDVSDASALKTGEQVFTAQCVACHGAGVAGAPKLGDATAWAPRIKTGYEALLASALKGKGAMGAQGGGDFSDLEIGRAVVHMANAAGAKFEEPKAAAPATAGAPASAAPAAAVADSGQAAADAAAAVAAATKSAAAAPAATKAEAPALYGQVCQACHMAGVAGAPKLGDKAAWAPRLAQGVDGLTRSVIAGKGAMPPKGGAAGASDADIKAVVSYMVDAVK
jgi:cytochrome c5